MTSPFVQPDGGQLDYNNSGSAIAIAADVIVGAFGLGFATGAISATTGIGVVRYRGIVKLTRNASDTFTQGQRVFWDQSASEVVNARANDDDVFLGFSVQTVGSAAAGTLLVELAPFAMQGPVVVSQATATTIAEHHTASGNFTVEATAAGTQAVAIPAAASCPGCFFALDKNGSAGAVTITPAAGTIAGGATYASADADNDKALFQAVGSDWVLRVATLA